MASSSLHALLGFCLGLASLHLVFVALPAVGDLQGQGPAVRGAQELPKIEADSPASAALRFGGGVVLGLVLLAAGKPAMADVEDVVIPAPRQICQESTGQSEAPGISELPNEMPVRNLARGLHVLWCEMVRRGMSHAP